MLNETYPSNSKASQQENEILQARDALKLKNAELKMTLAYLRHENRTYKTRFQALNQRLNSVNEWLEKNVRVLYDLFEGSKNALHQGRSSVLNSPLSEPDKEKSVHRANPKPGPSGMVTTRRKLHIERLNKRELEQSLENERRNISENGQEAEGEFTTVIEKNSPNVSSEVPESECIIREVYVRLSRLPYDVVQTHLRKNYQNMSNTASSFELTTSFSEVMEPELTSTPFKLETMRQLRNNFVNTRKRDNMNKTGDSNLMKRPPSQTEGSPVQMKEIKVQSNEASGSNRSKFKKKPRPLNPNPILRSPRVRKARPQHLKEPSLNKKMRAE